MNRPRTPLGWVVRIVVLYAVFVVLFIAGSMFVGGSIPANVVSEAGLVSPGIGLLLISAVDVMLVLALIFSSRWTGWKLAILLSLAYYGAVTVLMQIETWHFITSVHMYPNLIEGLFLMGLPTAFVFIPFAIWFIGNKSKQDIPVGSFSRPMPVGEWLWKIAALVILYVILYFSAGYLIAWQNPELRAFYGHPGEALPFFSQLNTVVHDDPLLVPLQLLRGLLWIVCAMPVIRGSVMSRVWTAVLVGLLLCVPQNIGLIIANPLMPAASVRLSHLIETTSSNFVFGFCVSWLLDNRWGAGERE